MFYGPLIMGQQKKYIIQLSSYQQLLESQRLCFFRELPEAEYRKQTFARKGPLSKTVTLTYPFNPYNKV